MSIREDLAEYAHSAWSGWMLYMFEKSHIDADGSLIVPKDLYLRWLRQAKTGYVDLPENEKESDRDEADRMLLIVENHIPKSNSDWRWE